MSTTVITPDFECPAHELVVIAGFYTTLQAPAVVGQTALAVPTLAASELSAAVGTAHTYVSLSDAGGTEDVEVWFEVGVLKCSPLTMAHPTGACVKADSHPLAMYCTL